VTAPEPPDDAGALARVIDHTLLAPDASAARIDRLCAEAIRCGFAAVCVNPTWVRRCAAALAGYPVAVASVVGFPLGANVPEVKAAEARRALADGAGELDMVMNLGAWRSGDRDLVARDVAAVVAAAHDAGAITKVIIETGLLDDDETAAAARLVVAAGAEYVKTSTGFNAGGATVHDVALIRDAVGPAPGVKAAGGIRTAADARAMLAAGATRIGTSAGVRIVGGDEDG